MIAIISLKSSYRASIIKIVMANTTATDRAFIERKIRAITAQYPNAVIMYGDIYQIYFKIIESDNTIYYINL